MLAPLVVVGKFSRNSMSSSFLQKKWNSRAGIVRLQTFADNLNVSISGKNIKLNSRPFRWWTHVLVVCESSKKQTEIGHPFINAVAVNFWRMKWQYQLTIVAILSIWSCVSVSISSGSWHDMTITNWSFFLPLKDSFRAFYPLCKGFTKETWAKITDCCDMFAFMWVLCGAWRFHCYLSRLTTLIIKFFVRCFVKIFRSSFQMRRVCVMECLQGDDNECCYNMCYANVTGIYANDTFNPAFLEQSLTNNNTADAATLAVVKQVISECAATIPVSQPLSCDVPEFIFHRARCCLIKGFPKCPKALANNDCKALLPTLASCTIKWIWKQIKPNVSCLAERQKQEALCWEVFQSHFIVLGFDWLISVSHRINFFLC